ncbi:MAG TPA: FixH family protein [Polyangiaceae bacterium]|nr:FixH family protein [Polyangiaceae bacterium]
MRIDVIRTGTFWALFPVVLLGSLVAVEFVLVHEALSDPSMAVEDRYYAKALAWDERRASERESARLGFHADVSLKDAGNGAADVSLSLVDRTGAPVGGAVVEIEAFAVARAAHVVRGALVQGSDGTYRATLPLDRPGRWEISVKAARGADRFTAVLRRDLTAGVPR